MKRIQQNAMIKKRALNLRQNLKKRAHNLLADNVRHELVCARCKAVFPEYLARCPECGSDEWNGLVEINPYTRMPMESFLKACGHLMWLAGTVGFLFLLWQTGNNTALTTELFIGGAILSLVSGVLVSALFFGLSELMHRLIRLQRRLRTFHDTYRKKGFYK